MRGGKLGGRGLVKEEVGVRRDEGFRVVIEGVRVSFLWVGGGSSRSWWRI